MFRLFSTNRKNLFTNHFYVIYEDIRSIASWGLDESAAVTWNDALLTWGDWDRNIYLVPLDNPDTSTLAVSSDAVALFNGGYRAKDGTLFLWEENGGIWTANSMGDQVQQALPTVDGTLLLMEDGTLELVAASMMERWSLS